MKDIKDIKSTVEALIFVSNNSITKNNFKEILKDVTPSEIEKCVKELNEEYEKNGRSFLIEEIAGGWRMRTRPEYSSQIKSLLNIQRRERLSGPALETMAIIAYKQPITKAEIEGIRGVNVDWVLSTLIEKGVVKPVGRKEVAGRPFMYGTTTKFLEHFGLASLKELPDVEELKPNITLESNAKSGGKSEPETVKSEDK